MTELPRVSTRALNLLANNLSILTQHRSTPIEIPDDPVEWHKLLFAQPGDAPLAAHHLRLWDWIWRLEPNTRPQPYAACWPRGHAKSGIAQHGVVAVAARKTRRYVLYVMETQDQADNAVTNIASLLESDTIGRLYPHLTQRLLGKHGNSRGWRRNRLRTSDGFTVDAMGMDSARRGANVDGERPDWIILDDIDSKNDTEDISLKKLATVTETILGMGTPSTAVLYCQNLITPHGIMARLGAMAGRVSGIEVEPAAFLTDIMFDGPIAALEDFEFEEELRPGGRIYYKITRGRATWEGMSVSACESLLNSEGPYAFRRERLNQFADTKDALLTRVLLDRNRVHALPECDEIIVAVDPPGTTGRCGIIVKGRKTIAGKIHTYTLADESTRPGEGPEIWAPKALKALVNWRASKIVAEINQGGYMVESTLRAYDLYSHNGSLKTFRELTALERLEATKILEGDKFVFEAVRAKSTEGKRTRAEPVAVRHFQGLSHMYGKHEILEDYWCRWTPGMPSPDPLDADVWAEVALVPDLRETKTPKPKRLGGAA